MFQPLLDFVAPHTCLSCGRVGSVICADCNGRVVPRPASCYRCNRLSPGGRTCRSCRSQTALSGVAVGAFYDGLAKDLILALKFERTKAAAAAGAGLLLPHLADCPATIVTSVPSAPARFRQRGYNQSALLARAVAGRLGLPYRELLGRHHQVEQIGAGRRERFAQVAGAFYALRTASTDRLLIVDDVLTTGATLAECATVLKAAGAKSVWGAVVAKH